MTTLELPPEEHFPDDNVSDEDVYAEVWANRRKLLEGGELLTPSALQAALSISEQALDAATQERRLFTVEVDGQRYYPVFCARPDINLQRLGKVSQELGSLSGWTKWSFFSAVRESLGEVSALEALARGDDELVREVARLFRAEVGT